MSKDVRALLRKAEKAGFLIDRQARHLKVSFPKSCGCPTPGEVAFGVSRTPGDLQAWKAIRSDFRKHGLCA